MQSAWGSGFYEEMEEISAKLEGKKYFLISVICWRQMFTILPMLCPLWESVVSDMKVFILFIYDGPSAKLVSIFSLKPGEEELAVCASHFLFIRCRFSSADLIIC